MSGRPEPLPPLQTLRAFESAARLASFTRAAHELNLTQGAISRQIRNLEQRLGVALFVRGDRGVHLTPSGVHYRTAIREALDRIARATATVSVSEEAAPITVGTTSAIASLWLMPRLTGFRRAEPTLDIRVLASDRDFERASDEVDLVIEYDRAARTGDGVTRLFDESVFPVCSPEYLRGRPPPAGLDDLLDETLLVLDDDHPDWLGWEEWLRAVGVEHRPRRRSVRMNSYPLLLQAAVAGQGIALGWRHLVDDFLATGSLVPVLSTPDVAPGAFYLGVTRPAAPDTPVARLRDWLVESARTGGARARVG